MSTYVLCKEKKKKNHQIYEKNFGSFALVKTKNVVFHLKFQFRYRQLRVS